MDVLTILIVLTTLFAFPLGEFARVDFGNGIAFTFLDVGVLLLTGLYLVLQTLAIIKKVRAGGTTATSVLRTVPKPPVLFLLVAVVSLLFNLWWLSSFQRIVAAMYLLRFGMYALLLFMVRNKKAIVPIRWSFLISGGLVLLAGFMQYFFYPSLANLKYAGWDQHLYRLFSTFLDPNFTGAFFVLYVLFVVDWLLKGTNTIMKISLGIVGILGVIGIFLTYSRAAYLMLVVGIVIYFFMMKQKKWIGVITIIVMLVTILVLSFLPKKSEGTNLFRTVSTFARIGNAENALTIFRTSPLIGVGFDTYRYEQKKYGYVTTDTGHGGAGADNSFLFVLATTGIIGLFAYLLLWLGICKKVLEKKSIVVFSSILALFVGSFFNNLLFYPFILFWIFLQIGFVAIEST